MGVSLRGDVTLSSMYAGRLEKGFSDCWLVMGGEGDTYP